MPRLDWTVPQYCVGTCGKELQPRNGTDLHRMKHRAKGKCQPCYSRGRDDSYTLVTEFNDTHQLCKVCDEWVPLDNFANDANYLSGKDSRCYQCRNLRKFGLTKTGYREMVLRQSGKCFTCPRVPTGVRGDYLNIDHCHRTGKVRGLLCTKCNFALGHFKDDLSILRRAISYLEKPPVVFPSHLNKGGYGVNPIGYKHLYPIYKIRFDGYQYLLDMEGDMCPICDHPTPKSVDHDHSCCNGKGSCGSCIRGIICRKCNAGLGNAGDSVTVLTAMVQYLEEHD